MEDTMGIILTEANDMHLRELTEFRSAAALPIGGRYRLIDFVLSGMVNSGIINVGVAARHKYASLMDHLGAGDPWDLQREHYGLYVLPPYANQGSYGASLGEVDILMGTMPYLKRSRQKYVVLSTGNTVCNITFKKAMEFHKQKGGDITVIYKNERASAGKRLFLQTDEEGRVSALSLRRGEEEGNFGMDIYILEKELLIRLSEDAARMGEYTAFRDMLLRRFSSLRMYAFPYEGYLGYVDTAASYFACNMKILREEVQTALFGQENAIFTRSKHPAPTRYGKNAEIKNCLVADGCIIEGSAENCIIFRGVKLAKHAHLTNCIVMEKTHIDTAGTAENVIFDKECLMREGRRLVGQPQYPVIIRKGEVI